jgi:hypothetical protein
MANGTSNYETGMFDLPSNEPYLPQANKLTSSFSKAPKGYVGPKEIAPALQEIDVKTAEAQKQLGESDIRIEKAKREETAKTAELKKSFYEQEKKDELAMPERAAAKAAREDLAAAKFEPTRDNIQDIAGLFSLMGVVGMVIGKKNALQGMYAMNGMMEGHRKGRKDLFTREAAEFDKQFKTLQAKVESATKELEEARKLRIYDQKAGEEAIAIAVARSESPLIKEMTARLGIEKTINVLNQTKDTVSNMVTLQNNLQKAVDDKELRRQMTLLKQGAVQERRDQKALESIGPALRNIAEQYPDGTANTLVGASPDDKKRIQGAFRAVEESENTADFVARNPRAVGALAAAKNFLKVDSIKSFQNDDEGAVVAAKAAEIDRQLDAGVQKGLISKDDAEAAKVLQKRLFGLALSDVQGSGQRGSVYLDKQFQNLYDQSSRANTLLKIIRERAEENNRNLKIYKLNVERNEMPERFPLIEASTQESFNKYIKDRAPAAPVVPEKVTAALKGKSDGYKAEYQGKKYIVRNGQIVEQ